MRGSFLFCLLAVILVSTGFAADTYTISGNILAKSGTPANEIQGVLMSATGGVASVTTNSSGAYTLTVPRNWSGQVTPSKDGFYFESTKDDLPYREYSNLSGNRISQNFDMKPLPTISGGVTFVTGTPQTVEIIASTGGQVIATTTTESNGSYALTVPYNWSGTLTPQLQGYRFTPDQRELTNVTGDLGNRNFEARILPSIEGNITTSGGVGIENVEISITGATSIYTDSSGFYSFTVPENSWTGTVTPIKAGYTFNPIEREYVDLVSSRTNQNYTGYLPPVINGTINVTSGDPQGILVTASNGGGSTITAQNGTYSLTVPYDWSGTVTPTKDGYYFNPTSLTYENLRQDTTSNYSGGLLPTISGLIRTPGGNAIADAVVTAIDEDDLTITVTTDTDGFYSISVPQGWTGTVTPSKTGFTFVPESKEFTNVISPIIQDFTGQLPLTISGNIRTAQSDAIAGVIVAADNGGTIDLTDAGGYYQLIVPVGWSGTVSVRRIGYTFDPADRSYTDLQDFQYNQDFEGLLYNMKLYGWGDGAYGQCDGPVDNQFITAIAAGRSHTLSVNKDGSVDAWGDNTYGQCTLPATNTNFVNVAAGDTHSLAIKKDGSIEAWGSNTAGQCDVPTPNSNYLIIAAGGTHSLALKNGGTIVAWGANDFGQTDVPAPNENFIGIAAGQNFSMGLKNDGTLITWGDNTYGQLDVPTPNENFLAISAGGQHALALKTDGSIVAWGFNGDGQTLLPEEFINRDFVAVSAGSRHSLALNTDGSIVGWGNDAFGQTTQQITLNQDFVILGAGGFHSTAVRPVIDLSGNGCVNNEDYTIFSSQWLRTDCAFPDFCQGADFARDGQVDLDDLSFLISYWLNECE